ncbi:MAG: hypothetical protein WAM04_19360 [Candidatus Sulfotelmatobacter sp.]
MADLKVVEKPVDKPMDEENNARETGTQRGRKGDIGDRPYKERPNRSANLLSVAIRRSCKPVGINPSEALLQSGNNVFTAGSNCFN